MSNQKSESGGSVTDSSSSSNDTSIIQHPALSSSERDCHANFLHQALEIGSENFFKHGGFPFGTVITRNGVVIAAAANTVHQEWDVTAHGEIKAIRMAAEKLQSQSLQDCDLYCTSHPCPMCMVAILYARPRRLFFSYTLEEKYSHGLSDFYDELAKPWSQRSIPTYHIRESSELGLNAFDGTKAQWKAGKKFPIPLIQIPTFWANKSNLPSSLQIINNQTENHGVFDGSVIEIARVHISSSSKQIQLDRHEIGYLAVQVNDQAIDSGAASENPTPAKFRAFFLNAESNIEIAANTWHSDLFILHLPSSSSSTSPYSFSGAVVYPRMIAGDSTSSKDVKETCGLRLTFKQTITHDHFPATDRN